MLSLQWREREGEKKRGSERERDRNRKKEKERERHTHTHTHTHTQTRTKTMRKKKKEREREREKERKGVGGEGEGELGISPQSSSRKIYEGIYWRKDAKHGQLTQVQGAQGTSLDSYIKSCKFHKVCIQHRYICWGNWMGVLQAQNHKYVVIIHSTSEGISWKMKTLRMDDICKTMELGKWRGDAAI